MKEIEILKQVILDLNELTIEDIDETLFFLDGIHRRLVMVVERLFGKERDYLKQLNRIREMQMGPLIMTKSTTKEIIERTFRRNTKLKIKSYKNFIEPLLEEINLELENKIEVEFVKVRLSPILERFHRFAKQLKVRHAKSTIPIIDIQNEYDVQDLLHALLKMNFDDVRPEEYTPSYAGASTKMDFLLKNERIVIEVKKTRNDLKDKEIGKQLIEDIAHYKSHPDCETLYCFIYDPDEFLVNPDGLETDLSKDEGDFKVNIIIVPK